MARGVSEQFVKIVDREGRAATRGLAALLFGAGLAYFLAELSDAPAYGENVRAFGLSLAAGALIGVYVGHRRYARYGASMRARWDHWMRDSVASATLGELARKVEGREPAAAWPASVALAALIVANATFFIAMWLETPLDSTALPVAVGNGLVVGAGVGLALWTIYWTRSFDKAVAELVESGAVGVWGER